MGAFWLMVVAVLIATLPAPAYPEGDNTPPPHLVAPEAQLSSYETGRKQARSGDWAGAVKSFRGAVQKDPKDHKAYNMLGYALRKLGKADDAIRAYNRALTLKPDYAPALEYRGVAHLLSGNTKAAIRDYQKLKELGSPLAEDLKEEMDRRAAN